MNKTNFKVVSFLAALTLMFSFTACGRKEKVSKDDNVKDATQQAADVKFETIADYVNSQELQEELAELRAGVETDAIDVQITSEDNVLIYTSKFNNLSVEDVDSASIDANLQNNAGSYSALARGLKEATNESNPVVRIIYLASDGQVIVSKDYGIE